MLAGKALIIWIVTHRVISLGGQHELIAGDHGCERRPDNTLAFTDGVPVRRVEERNAEIEASFEQGLCIGFVQYPRFPLAGADRHRAKAQLADLQAGPTERNSFHGLFLLLFFGRAGPGVVVLVYIKDVTLP